MLQRTFCLALLLPMLAAGAARTQTQDAQPTLLIQVRSLDAVLENIKILVALSGRENIATQVEGLIKSNTGPKGLQGVDPKRPFGFYGQLKGLYSGTAVALVPILDEEGFLKLLTNLSLTAQKNAKTGVYTVTGLPVPLYFRFAEKYAYVTAVNVGAIESDSLLSPKKVFQAAQKSVISVALRIDQLPKDVKLEISNVFENALLKFQEEKADESEAQKALRLQASKEVYQLFKAVLNEGRQLGLDLNIDRKADQMSLAVSLTPQPNSGLARTIADVGKGKSLFANLQTRDTAICASITTALPKSVQKLLADAIDDAEAKIVANIDTPVQRKQAEELVKALAPTFKAGEVDMAFSLQGPSDKKLYNLIAGIKVHKGAVLNKTLHKLLAELREQIPAENKELLELNVATIAGAKVHRFGLSSVPGDFRNIVGDSPLLLAISDEAIYVAAGPDAMLVLRRALTRENDVPAAPLTLELSLARLWPLLPANDKNREKLQELFPPGTEGSLRLTVEGGDRLNVRISSHMSLVKFLGATGEMK
jgi:hypothetical protein